jgi:hypothetical protein
MVGRAACLCRSRWYPHLCRPRRSRDARPAWTEANGPCATGRNAATCSYADRPTLPVFEVIERAQARGRNGEASGVVRRWPPATTSAGTDVWRRCSCCGSCLWHRPRPRVDLGTAPRARDSGWLRVALCVARPAATRRHPRFRQERGEASHPDGREGRGLARTPSHPAPASASWTCRGRKVPPEGAPACYTRKPRLASEASRSATPPLAYSSDDRGSTCEEDEIREWPQQAVRRCAAPVGTPA